MQHPHGYGPASPRQCQQSSHHRRARWQQGTKDAATTDMGKEERERDRHVMEDTAHAFLQEKAKKLLVLRRPGDRLADDVHPVCHTVEDRPTPKR
jgi:hypothetical protein